MATHWRTSTCGNKPLTIDDLASHVAAGNLARRDVVTNCSSGEVTQIDDVIGFDRALQRLKIVANEPDNSIRTALARTTPGIKQVTHDSGFRANKKSSLFGMLSHDAFRSTEHCLASCGGGPIRNRCLDHFP